MRARVTSVARRPLREVTEVDAVPGGRIGRPGPRLDLGLAGGRGRDGHRHGGDVVGPAGEQRRAAEATANGDHRGKGAPDSGRAT